jgi:hypothetical protein
VGGNGLRYTAEYYLTLRARGELYDQDEMRFEDTVEACFVPGHQGLLQRHPVFWRGHQEGPDDYVAVCHASQKLSPFIARTILEYGRRHHWVFNNARHGRFSLKAWLGRQGQLVAHMYFCAGEDPPWYLKAWWAAAVLWSCRAPKTDQDAWVLSWHLVNAAAGRARLCDWAGRRWYRALRGSQPATLSGILRSYFAPGHPLAAYFSDTYPAALVRK